MSTPTRSILTAAAAALAVLVSSVGPASAAADTGAADDLREARAATAADPGDLDWFFRQVSDGAPTRSFQDLGRAAQVEVPLVCDPDGTGDMPAEWAGNQFVFRNSGGGGLTVRLGTNDDFPLCGDWDGDGIDTPGVARGNVYFLAATNVTGGPVTSFLFGRPDDYPVVGDWDGNGTDTIALARDNRYFFASTNTRGGGSVRASSFGRADDFPVAGSFSGTTADTLALRRGNRFFVSFDPAGTPAMRTARSISFGRDTDFPVAGRLAGATAASVGVVRVE